MKKRVIYEDEAREIIFKLNQGTSRRGVAESHDLSISAIQTTKERHERGGFDTFTIRKPEVEEEQLNEQEAFLRMNWL